MASKVAIPKSPLGSLSPNVQLGSKIKTTRVDIKSSPRQLQPLDSPKSPKTKPSTMLRSFSSVGQWNEKINPMYPSCQLSVVILHVRHKVDEALSSRQHVEKISLREIPTKQKMSTSLLLSGNVHAFVDFFYITHPHNEYPVNGYRVAYSIISDQHLTVDLSDESLGVLRDNLVLAEQALRNSNERTLAMSYMAIGKHFESINDSKMAIVFFKKCLDIATSTNDNVYAAKANESLGITYTKLNNTPKATEHFEQHLALAKKLLDPKEEAAASIHLIKIYQRYAEKFIDAKEFRKAVEYLSKCLINAEGAQDIKSQGSAHHRLGIAHLELGEVDQAIHHLENFKQICKVTRDFEGQGSAFASLAKAYHFRQESDKAIALLNECKDLGERTSQTVLIADACANLGLIYSSQGNFSSAVQSFEEYLAWARKINDVNMIAKAKVSLGIAKGKLNLNKVH